MAITMQCDKEAQGAYPAKYTKDVWLQDTYQGCVIRTWERNGYDDSDFLALVWDEQEQKAFSIEYASTRGWSYCNGATVDATAEVIAKADAYLAKKKAEADAALREKQILEGDIVRLSLKAGKNRDRDGQEGRVFWQGSNRFSQSKWPETRYGVEFSDGVKLFFSARNVTKVRTVLEAA